ncbi:putative cellulase domain-containing protein [Phytophthora infestans]|uniref:Putative cellulase domain-containing protein n=1 Tax=Phytophthora infestans TaxID=4787 RepID=A0A833SNW6_PHYIN|nr:putative cellulase domain-containing protein [Phytophthora infestans]KAF4134852.1 putative cellulase domain-containing protein [Phytophthora infestans]
MKISTIAAALFASLTAHGATAGYVTTSGTSLELGGKPFYVFGINAYWVSEMTLVQIVAVCCALNSID